MNQRHPEDAFDAVKAMSAAETTESTARENTAWRYGLRLIDEAYFWEAHEVLEEVWMRAKPNSRERWLVQSVIHVANGALKNALGQQRAAGRLAGLAGECAQRAFAGGRTTVMDVSADALARCCTDVSRGEPPCGLAGGLSGAYEI